MAKKSASEKTNVMRVLDAAKINYNEYTPTSTPTARKQ